LFAGFVASWPIAVSGFSWSLDTAVGRPFARRTSRLEGLVHHLGLALGGRPGQSFARRLLLPVSKDTLLRVVRRHVIRLSAEPQVIGIDDWAWKWGHRYGTIICDLERRRIIDILPDREAATVTAWLAEHPSINVIARDRGAGYKQTATDGLPDAVQVADRWCLMENASTAFLNAVRRSMHAIRKAVGVGTVDPSSLSAAERRQHSGWLLREAENATIPTLAAQGVAIKEIMRRTNKSRGLVRQVVRGARTDMFRSRMSSLDPFLIRLETAWADGCHNSAALWRAMKVVGFHRWPTCRNGMGDAETEGRRHGSPGKRPGKAPSARRIARMMTSARDKPSKTAARTIASIGEAVPDLAPPSPTTSGHVS
jgi:transposase